MKYQDLLELKKRMDFNLTEPEVLVKLVEEARSKGEKAQKDMRRLQQISSKIADIFEKEGLILKEETLEQVKLRYKRAVGIDGSFQLAGGAGGKWYAPISVARIIFKNGFGSQPHVDIFWAGIQEIDETDHPEPKNVASLMMLTAESKAILNWGTLNKPSFVFIDGPVVDPPVMSLGGEDYIKDRCEGIKKCLEKSIVIGCVKRSRDRFYIKYLEKLLSNTSAKDYLSQFLTDQHLMAYIFAHARSRKYFGPIFTNWIDISSVNKIYELYKKHGIYVTCLFFQKSMTSPVLRLDIPFLNPPENDSKTDEIVLQAVKATDMWTYPGQDYPLPVILAHEKCNIREGCAQVLYEEIITKSRTVDPYNQLILTQLR
ncbi:MAG: hypothetical protein DRJ30_01550 [Candidatus Methanomethylicota archaeon]|nr:MAG: hypothetical protein DRJ30_01550 [Candidatus Verstraetearchaeota archaeon]